MTFITTARALDDQDFVFRVRAACWEHAVANVSSMDTTSSQYFYALHVLMYPQHVDPSMLVFVAVNDEVSAAITVSEEGLVSTTNVTDTQIATVVASAWGKVAVKYPQDPRASSPIQGQQTGGGVGLQ